ncbi:MAG: hypothetical protein AAGJ31_09815, partial [Verrucomicrobiota bacterium]
MHSHSILDAIPWTSVALAFSFAAGIIWLLFSLAIWRDAKSLDRSGRQLRFAGPTLWFLVVLMGNIPAAALYWAAHRSTLTGGLDRGSPPASSPTPDSDGIGPDPN